MIACTKNVKKIVGQAQNLYLQWHISEKCSVLGEIIPEQASQWLILSTKPHAITLQAQQSKVDSTKMVDTVSGTKMMEKNSMEIRRKKTRICLGSSTYFRYLPKFLDPKCFT